MSVKNDLVRSITYQSEYAVALMLDLFDLLETKAEIVFDNKEVKSICNTLQTELNSLESMAVDLDKIVNGEE